MRDRLRIANIPHRHKNLGDNRVPPVVNPGWNRAYQHITEMFNTGFVVVVIGDRGRGKTQLLADLVQTYIEKGCGPAMYIKAMDIFLFLRETYRPTAKTTERRVISELVRPGLLAIDAIEVRGESFWEDRVLNHIVDLRYDANKDTVIAGNINKDRLGESLGQSIISRANETGGFIYCAWESFRPQ